MLRGVRYIETVEVPTDRPEDYPGNARIHDDDYLDTSAKTNGQYRSVVARRLPDGRLQLLAGHGTRAAFRRQGADTIRVEVIEATDQEARRINLVDNPRPGIGGFDDQLLLDLLDQAKGDGGLLGTGWDEDAYDDLLKAARTENPFDFRPDGEAAEYTTAVNIPQYEVVGERPDLSELRDETRADALRAQIRAADIPDDVRAYLLAAAGRHTVFNYRKAAEFYPHASAEVQALMEESALVIIDVDDAIRLGYAKFMETINALREADDDES
jgi:hypothetical protein